MSRCACTPTTSGVPALAEAVAPIDAPVVERLRGAGAIPIARTNLPDLGLRIHTDSSLRGLTRNPWDPDVTAGGSSGGEAAARAWASGSATALPSCTAPPCSCAKKVGSCTCGCNWRRRGRGG